MTWNEIITNLGINLFAGILIFLLGLFWPVIPKSIRKFFLRRFWGRGVFGNGLIISYGTLIDSRLIERMPPPFRYVKRFHNGREIQIVGPWGNIVGECEIRSSSYIMSALSLYRKDAVTVMADVSAFANLNRTFVAVGSPSSNEITDLILREPNNTFFEFAQEGNTSFILERKTGRRFEGFQGPVRRDYGIVLKVGNLRFPGHYFFVCAGLGEWGTSGAAWFLATNWRNLYSEKAA